MLLEKTHRLKLELEEWATEDNKIVLDFVKRIFRSCVAGDGSGNIFTATLLQNELISSEARVGGARPKLKVRLTVKIRERPKFQEGEGGDERAEIDTLVGVLGLEDAGLLPEMSREKRCRMAWKQMLKKREEYLTEYINKMDREFSVVCALSSMVKRLQDEEDTLD